MASGILIGSQTAFSARSPLEPFEFAVAGGFTAFEWFPDKKETGEGWLPKDIDLGLRRYIRHTAMGMGITLAVHSRWQESPFAPGFHEAIREDILFARDIGAVLVNLHYHGDFGPEGFLETVAPILEFTSREDISLTLENTPLTSPFEINELFSSLEKCGDTPTGHLGMCLDIGHANLHDETRNNYLRYMDLLAPHVPIRHVHLHENYGDADTHLTVFTGPSSHDPAGIEGMLSRLIEREFEGAIILEQWPSPPELLISARDRLFRFIQQHSRSSIEAQPSAADTEQPYVFAALMEGNNKAQSWRQKLETVLEVITRKRFEPTPGNLAYIAIYLRFLGSGKISCIEDGRHFRPNRHAETSRTIAQKLHELTTPNNAFIMRNLYLWLPSFEEHFIRKEPLTRIRDIAHRNDIPKQLKAEIKHTLQNKLHRCAGPEDLRTSEALLKRILESEDQYPPSFVEEFRTFHQELKEFFNVTTLDERLRDLAERELSKSSAEIKAFLSLKERRTGDTSWAVKTFTSLTALRDILNEKSAIAEPHILQRFKAADQMLEDYAFVLLSRITNDFGAIKPHRLSWDDALAITELGLRNIIHIGLAPEECRSNLLEIKSLSTSFDHKDRNDLLRLKAAIDRALRFSAGYTDLILRIFPPRVEQLGHALGINGQDIRFFTEGALRGDIVFQLSRFLEAMLGKIRTLAELPPWDTLAAGQVSGKLVFAEKLDAFEPQGEGPAIIMAARADGEEDIPRNAAGIILGHPLPHLSHLGVRARQHGLVFAMCEDRRVFESIRKHEGKLIQFEAGEDGASISPSTDETSMKIHVEGLTGIQVPEINLATEKMLLSLNESTPETCGSKAWGMRRLTEMSEEAKAAGLLFHTPKSMVLPFSAYTKALEDTGEAGMVRDIIGDGQKPLNPHEVHSIRAILARAQIDREILKSILNAFSPATGLMVRSSSNIEDLPGFAGAGLYESVANAVQGQLDDAVRSVWSSLWSDRAVRARNRAGIPANRAYMAVLLQETLDPEYSFFLHTANPVTHNINEFYVELVTGLGEALASRAERGTPYRVLVNRKTGESRILAYANISKSLHPSDNGGLRSEVADYSKVPLTTEKKTLHELAVRLMETGVFVEKEFGAAQDIEGAIANNEIWLLQSRPQQGLRS